MNMKTASLTNRGGRKSNDDTVLVRKDANRLWAYVGDGLGGYAGGDLASKAAADVLDAAAQRGGLLDEQALLAAAAQADEAVCSLQQARQGNMKTTMVLLYVQDEQARWMHSGDTRLYVFCDGRLLMQTMDHSVSQMAVLMGDIRPDQIRFHEDRNRVLRCLGSGNPKPDISEPLAMHGGRYAFLLCTDGFWEYVLEDEMQQLLAKADEPSSWLAEMEKLLLKRVPPDHDNYTAAAIFCE